MNTDSTPKKPLGGKSYGSIPHLPGSRRGPADIGMDDKQAALLLKRTRDRHDTVIVQEKLDGSNVSVARMGDSILALVRSGYLARTSPFSMHAHFADWVDARQDVFLSLLGDGERACGEWLMEAHGTIYNLPHDPFVVFDIISGRWNRTTTDKVIKRCSSVGLVTPRLIHSGDAISVERVLEILEPSGHGAVDHVEGAVWRMERNGKVDFLAKYVRSDKEDGKYLVGLGDSTKQTIYNWHPHQQTTDNA